MKFALISLGFVLGLTASAGAQLSVAQLPLTVDLPPGSLWRATNMPHVIEAVTLQELCR